MLDDILKQKNKSSEISYYELRQLIGILAFLFPLILFWGGRYFAGCYESLPSLSSYYHTDMRNWFVGILSAVAFFLFCYKGEECRDLVAGKLAAIFAIGIAFFPTTLDFNEVVDTCHMYRLRFDEMQAPVSGEPCNRICDIDMYTGGAIHFTSAALFFIILIYFCLVLFRERDESKPITPQKIIRNRVYLVCGIIMILCVLVIPINSISKHLDAGNQGFFDQYNYVFIIEWIALWAFSISWLTKGQLCFGDR